MLLTHLDIQTNECLENNGGCWQDKVANVTACKVYWFPQFQCLLRDLNFFFLLFYHFPLIFHCHASDCRTLSEEEYVNALLCKV